MLAEGWLGVGGVKERTEEGAAVASLPEGPHRPAGKVRSTFCICQLLPVDACEINE